MCFLFLAPVTLSAQEFIIPKGTPTATDQSKAQNQRSDTLSLPFYDDFSYLGGIPDTTLWENNDVFISPDFTDNAPTWGTAVFDAVNAAGEFYEQATYDESHVADILTSKPIDLDYPGNTSIYLSFFCEAGGYGDTPEASDSLILEFLNVNTQTWEPVWFAEGTAVGGFNFVILPIAEEQYLQKGFQFRFKNRVSLGSYLYPDLAVNVDHWLIDLVYLDSNRNAGDNVFDDIALTSSLSSLLTPYSAMPYSHFLNDPQKYLSSEVFASYRNNDDQIRTIDSLKLSVADYPSLDNMQTVNGGSYNVPSGASQTVGVQTGFSFSDTGADSLTIEMKLRLVTDDFDPERNNSVIRYHEFSDFYAYDDGTAEAGYGLYGAGTKYGRLALKFYTEIPANVTAVKMYFNRSLFDEGRDYFFLNVWQQGEDGYPESEPAFSQEGVRPEYYDQLNTFHTYTLDEPVYVEDTFFVGWTQTQAEMLNVGFDLNTIANQYLYYNISGAWQPSQISGSVMIRPVMAEVEAKQNPADKSANMLISPNPAQDQIVIKFPTESYSELTEYYIYNLTGRLMTRGTADGNQLDVSQLPNGIYILKAITNNGRIYHTKFAVSH